MKLMQLLALPGNDAAFGLHRLGTRGLWVVYRGADLSMQSMLAVFLVWVSLIVVLKAL